MRRVPSSPNARGTDAANRNRCPAIPGRFYTLDFVRGLAALVILLLHWDHFFTGQEVPRAEFPARYWLQLLYANSVWAVDLFFCLSGFIFFHHYRDRVAAGVVSAWRFAVLRFARLYPLYLLSLALVVLLQAFYIADHGQPAVYGHYDLKHFLLNILMVSEWGMQEGLSFNGPAWSVSIEVLLYTVFFLLCRARLLRSWRGVFAMVGLGAAILLIYLPVGRGLLSFFSGGLAYLAFAHCAHQGGASQREAWSLSVLLCTAWAFALVPPLNIFLFESVQSLLAAASFGWPPHRVERVTHYALVLTLLLLLFPLTLYALGRAEGVLGVLLRPFALVGEASYGVYLLHFPVQITLMLVVDRMGWGRTVFLSPWSVPAFLALCLFVGIMSFRFFERPMQGWLCGRLLAPRSSAG